MGVEAAPCLQDMNCSAIHAELVSRKIQCQPLTFDRAVDVYPRTSENETQTDDAFYRDQASNIETLRQQNQA
jgi:hypothetical protein